MRIRPPARPVERSAPVRYGEGSNGKRKLIGAVMNKGYSERTAIRAVNAVFAFWAAALAKRQTVEFPLGKIRVLTTPRHLRNKRYTTRKLFGKPARLRTWKSYTRKYRILWKLPKKEWELLLKDLNETHLQNPDRGPGDGSGRTD